MDFRWAFTKVGSAIYCEGLLNMLAITLLSLPWLGFVGAVLGSFWSLDPMLSSLRGSDAEFEVFDSKLLFVDCCEVASWQDRRPDLTWLLVYCEGINYCGFLSGSSSLSSISTSLEKNNS
jgi:hypothetical protein